jgi:hypothetical protein
MGVLLDTFSKFWASAGTKKDPDVDFPGVVASGAVNNKQLPMEWYNWALDRIEHKVDSLIQNSPGPMPPGLRRQQLVQRLFSASGDGARWGHMYDADNSISYGSIDITDLDFHYPDDDETIGTIEAPRLLVLNYTNNKILEQNTVTGTTRDSGVLGGLLTTLTPDWRPTAFCNDNTYVYVMFNDLNNPRKALQAYALADWSVHPGWPATGIVVGGSALNNLGDRIIFLDAVTLLYLNSDLVVTGSTRAVITRARTADGSTQDTGAGDCPSGTGLVGYSGLCTDGTNVYFSAWASGVNESLCSATLADLTVGCGGAGWPYSPVATNSAKSLDLIWDGHQIISAWYPMSLNSYFLFLSTAATAAQGRFLITDTDFLNFNVFNMGYDGRNIWLRVDGPAGARKPILIPINVGGLSQQFAGDGRS